MGQATPNLLDTLYLSQQRQEWYRDYAQSSGVEPVGFTGSLSIDTPPVEAARSIRAELRMDELNRGRTRQEWLRTLIDAVEGIGALVMLNGVVGSNSHRKLDPEEFRGFALADRLAPMVFVNGADTKSAQIFTLLHEVAHIGLSQSALTDALVDYGGPSEIELWCNRVTAEVLVPQAELAAMQPRALDVDDLERLAEHFKVSTLVILRRVFDIGYLNWEEFRSQWRDEEARVMSILARTDKSQRGVETTIAPKH